ncbi:MAG: hypothetical protein SVR81_01695 [Chloroflexota bacterium]|nr:hypothetical protein [Chloroflexota bacterium]
MRKIMLLTLLVGVAALFAVNGQVQAMTIPTFEIQGVTEGDKVTIVTANFPANYNFTVRMGYLGAKGVNGILVGTVNSGAGGSLKWTFPIPTALQDESAIAIRTDSTYGGYYSYNWFNNTTFGSHTGGIPVDDEAVGAAVIVTNVEPGEYVIVQATGLPEDEAFDVLMGKYGTLGLDGIEVETVNSGDDGDFVANFDIPPSLQDEAKIAIRYESRDSSLVLYTWFENLAAGSGGAGGEVSGYSGIPTFSVVSVNEDEDVTIKTNNFPADKTFQVLMGQMWTQGIGGTLVTTISSGAGGAFIKTFDIPDGLKGNRQISIRLQTADNYFYAYNWFYNNTASGTPLGSPASGGYTGIPSFSISSVAADNKVTIQTNNFPADYDFEVLMGKMWTQGVDGIMVATIDSGSGGSFSKTFNIPAALAGEDRIAIRLQATTDGWYAYNWFYNNTYP